MLEIMLFKLHVISLARKRTNKKNTQSPLSSYLTVAVSGKSRGLFLGNSDLDYMLQKAKNLHKA